MKKDKLIFSAVVLLVVVGVIVARTLNKAKISTHEKISADNKQAGDTSPQILYYTCSMHPQIHADEPGNCPICGMRLVPVYDTVTDKTESSQSDPSQLSAGHSQHGGVIISADKQQLIGIKTSPVVKKHLARNVRLSGLVAFDPELASAIREYQTVVKVAPELKAAARSKLRLMGLSEAEIDVLPKQEIPQNLYLPEKDDAVWVYATLFEDTMSFVHVGDQVNVRTTSGAQKDFVGTVRSIDPILDATTRSVRARIEVPKAGYKLKPQTFVAVYARIDLGEHLTIPKSALIHTGNRELVFLRHSENHFESADVTLGPEGDDEVAVIGLAEGAEVVASSAFLVDAESQLKAAVSGLGAHQHGD